MSTDWRRELAVAINENKPEAKPATKRTYVGTLITMRAHLRLPQNAPPVDGVRWFFIHLDEILSSVANLAPTKRKRLLTALLALTKDSKVAEASRDATKICNDAAKKKIHTAAVQTADIKWREIFDMKVKLKKEARLLMLTSGAAVGVVRTAISDALLISLLHECPRDPLDYGTTHIGDLNCEADFEPDWDVDDARNEGNVYDLHSETLVFRKYKNVKDYGEGILKLTQRTNFTHFLKQCLSWRAKNLGGSDSCLITNADTPEKAAETMLRIFGRRVSGPMLARARYRTLDVGQRKQTSRSTGQHLRPKDHAAIEGDD